MSPRAYSRPGRIEALVGDLAGESACREVSNRKHSSPCRFPLQDVDHLDIHVVDEFEGQGEVTMREGTAWLQPPRTKHTVLDYSDDCEVLEIILPAEFKNGRIGIARLQMLTRLCEGQHATVLQLPASPRPVNAAEGEERDSLVGLTVHIRNDASVAHQAADSSKLTILIDRW